MIINCYQTSTNNLINTSCELARKSYETGKNCLALVPTTEMKAEFDHSLWSYSRKYFVPHATDNDPLPHKQPIFITEKFNYQNQAQIILLINPKQDILIEIFLEIKDKKYLVEKMIFLIDAAGELNLEDIHHITQKSYSSETEINLFLQKNNSNWQKLNSDDLHRIT